jgi:hypothetical protein
VAFLLGANFEAWPHLDFSRCSTGKLLPFRGEKTSSAGPGHSSNCTNTGDAAGGIARISPPCTDRGTCCFGSSFRERRGSVGLAIVEARMRFEKGQDLYQSGFMVRARTSLMAR